MTDRLNQKLVEDLDEGFVALVDAFGSLVLSIAWRLGDPASAQDAAQETFLRAYRALSNGRARDLEDMQLEPWIATIARNVVRNEWRRRGRKPTEHLDAATAETLGAPDASTPESVAADASSLQELGRSLSELSDPQREAIILRYVVGLSTRETSEVMGCPTGTVKSHVARGLASLRTSLATRSEEPS